MPEIPDVKMPGKGLVVIAWAVTATAFLILLIDYKIKQEIVASAKRVQADIERYERLYYEGKTGKAKPERNLSKPGSGDNSTSDSMVAGIAGMEAATTLGDFAHGMGKADPETAAKRGSDLTYPRTGSGNLAFRQNGGELEGE